MRLWTFPWPLASLIPVVKILARLLMIFSHDKIIGCKLATVPKKSSHKVFNHICKACNVDLCNTKFSRIPASKRKKWSVFCSKSFCILTNWRIFKALIFDQKKSCFFHFYIFLVLKLYFLIYTFFVKSYRTVIWRYEEGIVFK